MKTITTRFEDFYLDVTHNDWRNRLTDALETNGIITFDKVYSKSDLIDLAKALGSICNHRDSDVDGITYISKRENETLPDGYRAFSSSRLTLHTDGSSVAEPPTFMILLCVKPANQGGVSLLADGKQIYKVLKEKFPQILQALSEPGTAIFRGADTFLVSSVFSILESGNVCVRFRYDSLGYYSAPANTTLSTFLEILAAHSFPLFLESGQGYIIQNGRWLHGRTSFQGDREMYRILVKADGEKITEKKVHFGFGLGNGAK